MWMQLHRPLVKVKFKPFQALLGLCRSRTEVRVRCQAGNSGQVRVIIPDKRFFVETYL